MKKLFVITLTLLFISCSSTKSGMNFSSSTNTFTVDITINKTVKVPFIVDTGAHTSSIPSYVVMTLIKNGTIKKHHFLGQQNYRLANGEVITNSVVLIDEFQIGDKIISNIKCSVSENIDAPVLLGQNALKKLETITLNYGS